jgi:hypothetical protein
MNQRKILHPQQVKTPNGEGSTALPVSLNLYSHSEERSDKESLRGARETLRSAQGDVKGAL